jgi:hypothetical protein
MGGLVYKLEHRDDHPLDYVHLANGLDYCSSALAALKMSMRSCGLQLRRFAELI